MAFEPYRLPGGYSAEHWDWNTLADGRRMAAKCIEPICSSINDSVSSISGSISAETERAKAAESALSGMIDNLEAACLKKDKVIFYNF